jgi:ligand-binding SRPBCC domain-containing protein
MATLSERRTVDAPVAAVWAVLADVASLPELSRSTTEVEVDGPLRQVGQRFRQTVRLAGRRWTSDWTVTAFEPERRLVVEGSIAPGTAYRLDESLEAVDERRTTLTVTATYELPLGALGRLAGRLGVERRVADELGDVVSGVQERAEASDRAAGRTPS